MKLVFMQLWVSTNSWHTGTKHGGRGEEVVEGCRVKIRANTHTNTPPPSFMHTHMHLNTQPQAWLSVVSLVSTLSSQENVVN